jgi:Cu+-exporting ATPase
VERNSEHPLGQAVIQKAEAEGLEGKRVDRFQALAGFGVEAEVEGRKILIGNQRLMESRGIGLPAFSERDAALASEGKTLMYVARDGKPLGAIALADTLKDHSQEAVADLKKMGLEVFMLTGDSRRTAQAIGKLLDLDGVIAEVLPQDKTEKIKELQAQGKVVAMVGDGINDAPALAQADVGIALGTGTDVAMEAADLTLIRDDLRAIKTAVLLSRRTMRTIRQNLFWAFFYNTLGIPIAAGILYPFWGILLNPILASAAMAFSSVSVVSNSLRLKRFRP